MVNLITQKTAQQESSKPGKNEEYLSVINKQIEEANSRREFTTEITVRTIEELEKIKNLLLSEKFGVVWAKLNNNLYIIKIYWGPDIKIKKLNDPKIKESWSISLWQKNIKKEHVINPNNKKPILGITWKD